MTTNPMKGNPTMPTQAHNPDGSNITITISQHGFPDITGHLLLDRYEADGSIALLLTPDNEPDPTPIPLTVNLTHWYGPAPEGQTWVPTRYMDTLAPLETKDLLTTEDTIPPARYGTQGNCTATLYDINPTLIEQAPR